MPSHPTGTRGLLSGENRAKHCKWSANNGEIGFNNLSSSGKIGQKAMECAHFLHTAVLGVQDF